MTSDDTTQTGASASNFCQTRWSLITEIKGASSTHKGALLNALIKDYWKPIYFHIRKKGIPYEQAKDQTQDFFYRLLYEKDFFRNIHRSKGRFRTFLLTALDHYLVSEYRYQNAKKRAMHKEICSSELLESLDLTDSLKTMPDEQSFDYAWIGALIESVSDGLEDHYCARGKPIHWAVFRRRVVEPIIRGTQPPSLTHLCGEYGIEDEAAVSNMITTVKRAFRKVLRTRIREYVYTDSEVDEELVELLDFLQKKCRRMPEIA
jgi:RNA polymerase sigma-70 factor (ECF subfamily)